MNRQNPKGASKGKDTVIMPVGKLPPEFQATSSISRYGDMPIQERRKTIFNRSFYEKTWETLQTTLSSLGIAEDNMPAFECTFLHWFRYMEGVPMNVPLELLLEPLYEVERDAYFADLPQDESEETMASHEEIIVDTLTNVKNFISRYGVITRDFFDKDKNRFPFNLPSKGAPKGEIAKHFPPLGGKGKEKLGSTNQPKEPTPVPKQPQLGLPGKPKGEAIATSLKLQSPPPKVEGAAPLAIAKQPEQPKPKAEASKVADQPKPKAEASIVADQPKVKADPVVKADPPKAEGKSQSILSLASIKGRLGFGPPSKPERPPAPIQSEAEALEDDEDADIQAAIHESMMAPSSPRPESELRAPHQNLRLTSTNRSQS